MRLALCGIVGFGALAFVPDGAHRASAGPSLRFPVDLVASIPLRGASAPTGSQLMARLASSSREERSRVLVEQILEGNIPSTLRQLRSVETSVPGPFGALVRAVVWVMPDYLAVGSDEDSVRVPLGLEDALTVARRFGFTLPTRRIVNAIHRQAEARLEPKPMPPCAAMTSVAYLWAHNRTIEEQQRRLPSGTLVSGTKKDVVITPRLASIPGRVAIYGWLHPDGAAIQPLSTVHAAWYADYSHGIRLVSDTVFVDGLARSVFDVLEDPARVGLLSDEGVVRDARRLLGPAALGRALN
ncbi:MAG: hypothetical protein IPN83_05645 [Holophagales bacterium]|nr:hypothetical protein [Holophagales bacterium]